MRPEQPKGELAKAIAALVALEKEVAANAKQIDPALTPRVYGWRPTKPPADLPGIWNWIEPSTAELADNVHLYDLLVVRATIGVKVGDLGEGQDKLTLLTDVFRATVDPALDADPSLGGAVKEAKRTVMRSEVDVFNDVPVLCMSMLLRLTLSAAIR